MSSVAIQFEDISKSYLGKKYQKVQALNHINFFVESGEIFGFLGPNGAGKSTTIKILMDFIRASSGSAQIKGIDTRKVEARKVVGFLPENPSFYDSLSAWEYLSFVGKCYALQKNDIELQREGILKRLDLWDSRKRPIRTYSKGMVQRLAFAQVLMHDPEILILDEPMSGLDPIGRSLVKEILVEQKSLGKSIFFSTHITADVEQICDRVGILVSGQLKSIEPLATVFTEGIEGYLVLTEAGSIRKEYFFPKELIADEFIKIVSEGEKIVLIEPKRKNLEAFFLDIVKTSAL